MATKYLDNNGLLYFWQKIKNTFAVVGHNHNSAYVSDVTYDSTNKKIQKSKNGSTTDIVTLATVATSGSYNDLSNKPTIPASVEKTTTTPKMDGTAAIGSETKFAAGDHVHPSDTSRVPTTRMVNNHALSSDVTISASDIPCTYSGQTVEDDIEIFYDRLDEIDNIFAVKIGETTFAQVDAARTGGKYLIGYLRASDGSIAGDWEDYSVSYDASESTYEFLRWEYNQTAQYDSVYYYTLSSSGWGSRKVASNYKADTKNTAGSTDSSSKLFLVGATSQAANPQTYSQDTAYVGTDGHLYSNSKKVVNLSDSQALTNKTYNGYTLGAACAKGIVTAISNDSADLPTVTAVKNYVASAVTGAAAFQGTAPTSFAPTNYKAGYYWVVGTAGTYAGQVCEVGDMVFAISDYSSSYKASDFDVVQTNLDIGTITNAEIDTIVAS